MIYRLIMAACRQISGQGSRVRNAKMLPVKTLFPQQMTVRAGHLIPKTQYDIPISPKLKIPGVMFTYWETIPLFFTTATSISILFIAIVWAIRNKVDVVFKTHSRENISRTMDLCKPTIHKMVIINQRYKPWPELQAVLEKMKQAECKAIVKANTVPQS